ncbi:MAG: hypothetical protein HY962_12535 [Ignavibacteriae bacterium]|nr:hypothetical protein [Ignavibacteriota bacterium]
MKKLLGTKVTGDAPLPEAWLSMRDEVMHELGIGTMRSMRSVITGIFLPSLLCTEYTMGEKVRLWRGKLFSQKHLRDVMWSIELPDVVPALEIPVYMLHGRHDMTCAYAETRAYAAALRAPVKGFYTFEESAHSPLFEEPARFRMVLEQDVLQGRTGHADSLNESAVEAPDLTR